MKPNLFGIVFTAFAITTSEARADTIGIPGAPDPDPDCVILFCAIAGFVPEATGTCAKAFKEMVDRITPWPIEPPFGICTGPDGTSVNGGLLDYRAREALNGTLWLEYLAFDDYGADDRCLMSGHTRDMSGNEFGFFKIESNCNVPIEIGNGMLVNLPHRNGIVSDGLAIRVQDIDGNTFWIDFNGNDEETKSSTPKAFLY